MNRIFVAALLIMGCNICCQTCESCFIVIIINIGLHAYETQYVSENTRKIACICTKDQ